ncbi:Rv3654c family TadE-like protein [Rhodococcus olei]
MRTGPAAATGDDRGSATVTACFAMLALITLVLTVGHLGAAVVARHRAQAAADLGALAAASSADRGADGACAAAGEITGRMGARVSECRFDGWDVLLTVTVPVAVGSGAAVAAARAGPAEG